MTADLTTGTQDTIVIGHRPQALRDSDIAFLPDGPAGNHIVRQRPSGWDTLSVGSAPIQAFGYSPDGTRLAVVAPDTESGRARHDLFVANPDGTIIRRLTATGDIDDLVWCGDSTSILVSSATDKLSNQRRRVWRASVHGGDLDEVVLPVEGDRWPTDCSDDGARVTFELRLDRAGMFVGRRGDGPGYELDSLGAGRGARWSPDGTLLAFVDGRDGQPDVYVRDRTGTERRITADRATESDLSWSPDGRTLVFARRSPRRGVWLVHLDDVASSGR